MKNVFHLSALIALTLLCSCGKQQTDAEKNAEIERKVQERLAAEHQTQEQQRLSQAQVDLDQRLKEVENRNNAAPASVTPAEQPQAEPERDRNPRPQVRDDAGDEANASYSTFYTKLEPEGEWRQTATYGYVWQPRVAEESRLWRPYINGRWVYTEAGWTWISDEPFGWATYHYGRWTRLQNIGWVWVPGSEWAPAWVSWRKSNDYVGWAPLPPEARFERGRGIHNWADNYYDIGPDRYAFVPTNQLGDQRMERAVVPTERNVAIINQTTNITNISYNNTIIVNQGPNYEEMRSRSQQPIARLRLERKVTANFDAADPHPVVRGEVVEMPAPVFARAQPADRPRRVKEAVSQVVVDHGSEGLGDQRAAEQARAKMKSEATPPPNAPSRTFVKPAEAAPVRPTATVAATPVSTPSPVATATPMNDRDRTPIPGPSVRRDFSPKPRQEISPSARETVSPVASMPPRASIAPSATPVLTPVPRRAVTPEATAAPSSPTPRVNATVNPAPPAPHGAISPVAPAGPGTSGSHAVATPPPAPTRERGAAKEERKEERRAKRAGTAESPTPSP